MSVPNLRDTPAPSSLYIHFPFCAHRCHYCDFSVAPTAEVPVNEWLAGIGADLESWFAAADWDRGCPLETVFVGGGTPSLLGGPGMARLGLLLREYFDVDAAREWTVEANPNSLTAEVCDGWLAAGVNRLSIGVQSFSDEPLRWLGRLHDAAEAVAALRRARSSGFSNVNADLIFGLPESIERDWPAEVQQMAGLGVTHVSVYGLTAEPRTPLGRRVGLGRVHMPPDDRYVTEYLAAARTLVADGYVHYEVRTCRRGPTVVAQLALLGRDALPWSRTLGAFLPAAVPDMERIPLGNVPSRRPWRDVLAGRPRGAWPGAGPDGTGVARSSYKCRGRGTRVRQGRGHDAGEP